MNIRRRLEIFLWLVALHSFCVGIGLIIIPENLLNLLGFETAPQRFFITQGGVFHLVLVAAYLLAARSIDKYPGLIFLSITAKFIATLFLTSFYLFADHIIFILISGITDLIMGLIIVYLYRSHKNSKAV